LQYAWDNNVLEAYRSFILKDVKTVLNVLLPSYYKNVIFESFSVTVIEKQLRRYSSYVIERLLRGYLNIHMSSLKLLKSF